MILELGLPGLLMLINSIMNLAWSLKNITTLTFPTPDDSLSELLYIIVQQLPESCLVSLWDDELGVRFVGVPVNVGPWNGPAINWSWNFAAFRWYTFSLTFFGLSYYSPKGAWKVESIRRTGRKLTISSFLTTFTNCLKAKTTLTPLTAEHSIKGQWNFLAKSLASSWDTSLYCSPRSHSKALISSELGYSHTLEGIPGKTWLNSDKSKWGGGLRTKKALQGKGIERKSRDTYFVTNH